MSMNRKGANSADKYSRLEAVGEGAEFNQFKDFVLKKFDEQDREIKSLKTTIDDLKREIREKNKLIKKLEADVETAYAEVEHERGQRKKLQHLLAEKEEELRENEMKQGTSGASKDEVYPNPTPEMQTEIGQVREYHASMNPLLILLSDSEKVKTFNAVAQPVEVMSPDGKWNWIINGSLWAEALKEQSEFRICSPPVLLPASLGGYKLLMELKIRISGSVQFWVWLPEDDSYNIKQLTAAETSREDLRNICLAVTTQFQMSSDASLPVVKTVRSLGSIFGTFYGVDVAKTTISGFSAQEPPVVNLQMREVK